MAADLAPAPFQQWTFEKRQSLENSPASERSEDFFDAEDKLRISPNMNEIRAALLEKTEPVYNHKEYLSSEEALSPVMDEPELSDTEELEEEVEMESEELTEVDLWEEIKVFALDIAITLSMQFVGRPKMVELHSLHSHDSDFHVAPLRFDSLPPKSERRTQVRASELPAYNSRFSGSSMDPLSPVTVTEFTNSPDTLHSRFSGSSYAESPTKTVHAEEVQDSSSYTESTKSSHRNVSIFSIENQNISANWTPPLSDISSESPTPSFLQSDPYEHTAPLKPTHSRVRSISSRFPKFSFGSKKEGRSEEEKVLKKERRNSFFRPATPTSIYDGISSMASRDSGRPSTAQAPPFIAPLQQSQSQRLHSRMVPRAADERADAIRLPPCPDNFSPPEPELLRSQTSFIAPVTRRPLGSPIKMRRRRSVLGMGY
jgi:hypothetical protein